jgi:hypothetical protein
MQSRQVDDAAALLPRSGERRFEGFAVNQDRPEITVVTDISANIFAVFILILIILLVARNQAAPARPEAPTVVDASEFAVVERAPLSPAAMVELLYERRASSPATKIDLFDDRIEVTAGPATRRISLAGPVRPEMLPPLSPDAAIGVYVFGHRGYRFVTDALMGASRAWREISVPAALRRRDPATGIEDWSGGFKELLVRPRDLPQFRTELARLLASPRPAAEPTVQRGAGAGGAGDPANRPVSTPTEFVEHFASWLKGFLGVLSLLAGLAFIVWVERSARRLRVNARLRPPA